MADFDAALALNPASAESWRGRGDLRAGWAEYRSGLGEEVEALSLAAIADFDQAPHLDSAAAETWASRGNARTIQVVLRRRRGEDAGEANAASDRQS